MKFNHNWKEKKWANYAIALCIAVFFYLVLSHINIIFGGIGKFFGFIKPVIYALIIAYILNPLSNLFERKFFAGMKRRSLAHILSVAITIILVVALLVLLIAALVPQLTSSAMTLLKNLSGYIESFRSFIDGLLSNSPGEHPMIQRLTNIGTSLLGSLENSLPTTADSLISTFSSIGSNIVNGVISFILAIYFLLDKNRLIRWFVTLLKLLFSQKRYREVADFWLHCNTILIRYIFSDLIDGLIIGLANFIFQMIAGLPYAVLISVVVGVTNLAPTFGPLVGGVIGAVILVLINPWYALWFIIFTLILQTCDGYVLKPKLFSGVLGVSSVWVLICIIVGGRMFGVPGILLSIPFAAISDYIYNEFILVRLRKRRQKKEAGQPNAEPGQEKEAVPDSLPEEDSQDEYSGNTKQS